MHITDVAKGLRFFADKLKECSGKHDHDKISDIDGFYRDFRTNFDEHTWWDNHRGVNRHHINMPDGVPANVNLVDVIEHITDCVMAGMARSGEVYDLKIPNKVLQDAFQNTIEMLKDNVQVEG